jgi:hypothetical protein
MRKYPSLAYIKQLVFYQSAKSYYKDQRLILVVNITAFVDFFCAGAGYSFFLPNE